MNLQKLGQFLNSDHLKLILYAGNRMRIMKIMNTNLNDATTKVILCKDPKSSALKGKYRFYQFYAKRIRT